MELRLERKLTEHHLKRKAQEEQSTFEGKSQRLDEGEELPAQVDKRPEREASLAAIDIDIAGAVYVGEEKAGGK